MQMRVSAFVQLSVVASCPLVLLALNHSEGGGSGSAPEPVLSGLVPANQDSSSRHQANAVPQPVATPPAPERIPVENRSLNARSRQQSAAQPSLSQQLAQQRDAYNAAIAQLPPVNPPAILQKPEIMQLPWERIVARSAGVTAASIPRPTQQTATPQRSVAARNAPQPAAQSPRSLPTVQAAPPPTIAATPVPAAPGGFVLGSAAAEPSSIPLFPTENSSPFHTDSSMEVASADLEQLRLELPNPAALQPRQSAESETPSTSPVAARNSSAPSSLAEPQLQAKRPATGANQAIANQISADQATFNQVLVDRAIATRPSARQPTANQVAANQVSLNRAAPDRVAASPTPANPATANRVTANRVTASRVTANPATANSDADRSRGVRTAAAGTSANAANRATSAQAPSVAARTPMLPTNIPGVDADPSYVLGAGDTIQVSFFNVPEYSGQHRVLVNGTINLPVVGEFSVAGMNLREAETAIAEKFSRELRNIRVSVSLLQTRPLRVGVAGEVRQPGFYRLASDGGQLPSVAQVIQSAGGVTQSGNLRQVQIRRAQRSGPPQILVLNLWEMVRTGDLSQNISLRDGDTVYIPPATAIIPSETAQLADSNLSSDAAQSVDIALVGEVLRPGAYKLAAEGGRPTLTQAIQAAGGITTQADLRQVQVRRMTRNGEEQVISMNLWDLVRSGDLNQDLILQPGDRIVVAKASELTPEEMLQLGATNVAASSIRVNIIGEVQSPGSTQVTPNTTLNQALLNAGGFSRRARREVQLIRLNPDGTLMRRRIDVDFSRGVDMTNNPILWNNDVIIVGRNAFFSVTDSVSDVLGAIFRILPAFQLFF